MHCIFNTIIIRVVTTVKIIGIKNFIKVSSFKNLVFDTLVLRNIKLSESPSFGIPAIAHDADSKGAVSYLNLAKEILAKNPQLREEVLTGMRRHLFLCKNRLQKTLSIRSMKLIYLILK